MKKLYVCQTVYQLLLSLIKRDKNDHILFLGSWILPQQVTERLQKQPNIRIESIYQYWMRMVVLKKERLEKIMYFKQFDEIYTYMDHREIGAFLTKHKLKYHLLEDGLNFFGHPPIKQSPIYKNRLKEMIYRTAYPFVFPPGNSPMCQTIEVNDLSVIIKDYSYQDKFIEVPRTTILSTVSNEKKEMLREIFQPLPIEDSTKKKVLILTQPLYISEKSIPTMQTQKQYYASIISEYIDTHDVYLKVHPRDEVDYSDIAHIRILESHIPMELYELLGSEVVFDIVATHSSSAIEQIKNAKVRKYYKNKIIGNNKQ